MPRHLLDKFVYLQKREVVFRASFNEVNAHSQLAVLLYEDWIGRPIQIKCLSNEADSEKPINLITESLALSSFIFFSFYFIVLTLGFMASKWQMMAGLMPGMLVGAHSNTSKLSERTCLNMTFSSGGSLAPIQRARLRCKELTWNNSASSSDLSGFPSSSAESRCWHSSSCDCYWSAIRFCFFLAGESSSVDAWATFDT